ncbi:MAG: hypothetical protein IJY31_01330 [Muribaculaceae bacterium]|nr:hypothetical protein [Muribaculaceae bacterium]
MKNLKLFLVAGLLTVSAPAFAQFLNPTNSGATRQTNDSSKTTIATTKDKKDAKNNNGFTAIYAAYNPISIKTDADNTEDLNLTGFSLGYNAMGKLSGNLHFGMGLRFTYGYGKQDVPYLDDFWTYNNGTESLSFKFKYSLLSIGMPISLGYNLTPNSSVSLIPYIGLNFKGVVPFTRKTEVENLPSWLTEDEFFEDYAGDIIKKEYDLTNEDEVTKDGKWKQFQLGWHVGCHLLYKALYLGVSYENDFTELCKKTKMSQWTISIGYNF